MGVGKVKLICVAGAAGLWLAGVAEGSQVAISYLVQNRSVSASSAVTGFARGGTQSAPITDQDNHSQGAGGFGSFAGNVAANSNVGPGNVTASGSASQNSTLGGSGFSASGAVRADSFINTGGPASGSASSVFHVTFDVAQAESYTFTASLNSSNDFAIPTSDQVNIQLTNGGSNIFAPITAISVSGLELKGTLNPGTYVFAMDVSAASTDQSDNFVNYSVALADGNVAAGPVSNAVPLPSALTESLVMLGGLGIAATVRRRTPAWARASMV